jgi:hypothetical protein
MIYILLAIAGMIFVSPSNAADTPSRTTVNMTITEVSLAYGRGAPQINLEDVVVEHDKQRLPVTALVPARGTHAGLDLFVLIDEASTSSLVVQLEDVRRFIRAQPATTAVGVGYMKNASVQIAQALTSDHEKAASALRPPHGYSGADGSPYLSAVNLMARWAKQHNRREIVMITDGIDPAVRTLGMWQLNPNPNVDFASGAAQRTGTIIHTIYASSAKRSDRSYWKATSGQMDMARLSKETGGKSFYLGLEDPVSYCQYLDRLQEIFDNQYLLSFSVVPGKKSGLQRVKLSTPIAGVLLSSHEAVWVPALRPAE